MLSGSYVTTLYNTICRIDVAFLSGADNVKAAGDDTVEDRNDSAEEIAAKYADLGFKVRVESDSQKYFDFCSHRFWTNGAHKVQFEACTKALFSFFSKHNYDHERSAQLLYEIRNNDEFQRVKDLILDQNPDVFYTTISTPEEGSGEIEIENIKDASQENEEPNAKRPKGPFVSSN
jgi:hypothetical protein